MSEGTGRHILENLNEHSTAKLALAIFTSPGAAFEEINRRRLLGTALIISAITGTVAMIPPLIAFFGGERLQWLVISQYNPIAWIGLLMLYVLAMQKLLKWIGAQVDFVALLTVMGWAQLALLLAELSTVGYAISGIIRNPFLASASSAGIALFSLWYIALMGPVVQSLIGVHKTRGILTYIVVQLAIWIGLTYTYVNTRVSGFEGASGGVIYAITVLGYADKLPWAATSVLGLAVGVASIAKHFGWQPAKVKAYAAGAAALGLVLFGAYAFALHQTGYYGTLGRAYVYTLSQQYSKAAKELESFAPLSKDNSRMLLDIGELHFLAGQDAKALQRYREAADSLRSREAWDSKIWLAQAYDGAGAVYDQQGKYPEALAEFDKAAKAWPQFREPWVRMAVTYDRMGKYDKALEAADHAMKKLESEATIAWVALAQASAQTGKTTQAKAAITIVTKRDEKLAGRLGKSLDDWKHAVDRLTRMDLKYPLELEPAPAPKKAPVKAKPEKR